MTLEGDNAATTLLRRVCSGEPESTDRLMDLVYDDLRALAGRLIRAERAGHTLQPTALVHEAYLRLIDQSAVEWRGRAHFMAIAARMIRRVLVDHARARGRLKRGGDHRRISLTSIDAIPDASVDLLDLEDALEMLARLDERHARVVELRFFGGLSDAEAATVLGVTDRTVRNDWRVARAWLQVRLDRDHQSC